jgi:aromatic-amino-acid transaminase
MAVRGGSGALQPGIAPDVGRRAGRNARSASAAVRVSLVDKLAERGCRPGLFLRRPAARHVLLHRPEYVGQVDRLRDEFGIYAVSTGRICLAALNTRNIDYVADAIAAVL